MLCKNNNVKNIWIRMLYKTTMHDNKLDIKKM